MRTPDRPSLREWAVLAMWCPVGLWALVRVLGIEGPHPLPGLLALTPYAVALSVLPLAAAAILRVWRPALPAAATTLVLLLAVAPRAIDGPRHATAGEPGVRLTVMTANILGPAGDPGTVVRLVRERRVEVLSLQELTPAALAALDRAGIRRLLPERVLDPRPAASGSGLMARRALRRTPPSAQEARVAVHAQPEAILTLADGGRVVVKAIHPVPPRTGEETRRWRRQLAALPGPRAGSLPRVLAGDFNATLDHSELRKVLDRGFTDAADATGDGLRSTWRLRRLLPGITIDHVLFPAPFKARSVAVEEIPGSDHLAVIADLLLPHSSSRAARRSSSAPATP